MKVGNEIGPGYYEAKISQAIGGIGIAGKKINRSQAHVGFSTGQNRFEDGTNTKNKNNAHLTPGPGSYQAKQNISDYPSKAWGKNGVFGSTERRFVPKGNQPMYTPGPGTYIQPDLVGKQTQMAGEIKRSSSMFLSKTKRNPHSLVQRKSAQNQGC